MSRFRAEGALLLAALLYGITFPMVKDALDDITPYAYLLGRFAIATVLVAPSAIAALLPPAPFVERRLLLRVGAIAGLLLFLGYITQTVGLQYTTPSTSAFITGLYALMTPLVEAVVRRRLPTVPVAVGAVVAAAGLYFLTGASLDLGRGEWLTLVAAFLFACHIVYLGAYVRRIPPAPFTGMQLGVMAVLCIPPTAVDGVGTLTAYALFAVVFTGLACSAIALPLQVWGQRRIPAPRAALILLAEPVFAGIASWITGERLDAVQLVGAAVILGGIAISEIGADAREHDEGAPSSGAEEVR